MILLKLFKIHLIKREFVLRNILTVLLIITTCAIFNYGYSHQDNEGANESNQIEVIHS